MDIFDEYDEADFYKLDDFFDGYDDEEE